MGLDTPKSFEATWANWVDPKTFWFYQNLLGNPKYFNPYNTFYECQLLYFHTQKFMFKVVYWLFILPNLFDLSEWPEAGNDHPWLFDKNFCHSHQINELIWTILFSNDIVDNFDIDFDRWSQPKNSNGQPSEYDKKIWEQCCA